MSDSELGYDTTAILPTSGEKYSHHKHGYYIRFKLTCKNIDDDKEGVLYHVHSGYFPPGFLKVYWYPV
ncbi:hypothetical protein BDY19DRAFT_928044 [Irpex rosettiformis]|uniref:Uncharacterized protein n=1 Tax=Irpex rosettiformis TaxID=378272 RepID=A0ACB8UCQ6_9APHY|nr:hypothetical protein BDY19DRAFT_928044 [Irpex rosettiformis]